MVRLFYTQRNLTVRLNEQSLLQVPEHVDYVSNTILRHQGKQVDIKGQETRGLR